MVFEVSSPSTSRNDEGRKREIYGRIGVAEYVLYDPLGELLERSLQGYRLVSGAYEPLPVDATGALVSERLGLRLRLVDGRLRFFEPDAEQLVISLAERAPAEIARADAPSARAAAAAARADAASARAEAEAPRAEAEAGARRTAQERTAELEGRRAERNRT